MNVMLDVGAKLVLASDVCPLAATADLYAVETILHARLATYQLSEPLPTPHMTAIRACRYTNQDCFRKIHQPECPTNFMRSPSCVDIAAILEAENHAANVLLLKGGTAQVPLWNVIEQGKLHHGVFFYRVNEKRPPTQQPHC